MTTNGQTAIAAAVDARPTKDTVQAAKHYQKKSRFWTRSQVTSAVDQILRMYLTTSLVELRKERSQGLMNKKKKTVKSQYLHMGNF